MNTVILLIFEFFKTGLFAIGGGLATIPFLVEMGEKYHWFTAEMLSTMIAVSESTPGAMGINMATYVGFTTNGPICGIITTLSLVTPSIIVISIIARYLEQYKNSKIVNRVFLGIKPVVVALIISATLSIFINALLNLDLFNVSKNIFDLFNYKALILLLIGLFVYHKKPKLHPIFFIVAMALCGIIFKL